MTVTRATGVRAVQSNFSVNPRAAVTARRRLRCSRGMGHHTTPPHSETQSLRSIEPQDAESRRLAEDTKREKNWKRWGAYLSERQWGTVREDYSEHGNCWDYFPHDHARSRAYRWGED